MNLWLVVYRSASVVVAVLALVLVVCLFMPKFHRYRELQRQRQALEQENASLEGRARQIERNRDQFETDPDFVERLARERGRAKPGETVFRAAPSTNGIP
jgi:cell division protein FtsB